MHDNLVILAGGASSRMKISEADSSLSKEEIKQANQRSKGLISIDADGRPLLDYLLYNAKVAGYKSVFLVVGSDHELFKKMYGSDQKDNDFHGLTISYAIQHIPKGRVKPWGTADAVYQALQQYPHLQSDYFTVCNCDNLYSVEALKALRETSANNALIAYDRDVLGYSSTRAARFAVLEIEDNTLVSIVEKPNPEKLEHYKDEDSIIRISMNIFKFNGKELFKYLKNCHIHPIRNEKEIPTALMNYLSVQGNKILTIPIADIVPDLTSKEDIPVLKEFINNHFGQLIWQDES